MINNKVASNSFTYAKPFSTAKLRLFCLPYAGCGAHIYRDWERHLPNFVEVHPVQLPGRGTRLKEASFAAARPLVEALAEEILPLLDIPFVFFGHSMGALLSFELSRLLRRSYGIAPLSLFVSARMAPHLVSDRPKIHALPDSLFREEVRRLNGTPDILLEDEEFMRFILPVLRSDFALCETYAYGEEAPLNLPITAFGGAGDVDVSLEGLQAWENHTDSHFSLHMLPGDHFFLHGSKSLLLHVVSARLKRLMDMENAS